VNNGEFLHLLGEMYPGEEWPKPFHLLQGASLVDGGMSVGEAARSVNTNARTLAGVVSAADRVEAVLGAKLRGVDQRERQRAIRILGQLLLGRAAETAFEDIYRSEMESHELELRDLRESRSDTDYRLYNGQGRPVYRINIKFHGALFRRAQELVNLEADDCFALATYKIHSALGKQEQESLPYFFAVVGERSLSGEGVGAEIPSRFIEATAFLHGTPRARAKRDFEDRAVEVLVRSHATVFARTYEAIRKADWYVLSARKADRLVRAYLYDRVYALRIRNFTRTFRGAEVDMHFSLSRDLVPLHTFLTVLRNEGQAKIVTLLERGEY